jgi:hypothetical protein
MLAIKSCSIGSIAPGTFSGLPNLETLDLNQNLISKIALGSFKGLRNLKRLYLEGQVPSLQIIENGALKDVSNLDDLNLSNNPRLMLNSFRKGFLTGLKNLRTISLNEVGLSGIPPYDKAWENFFQEQVGTCNYLGLRNNGITTQYLPILKKFERLRYLDLQDNAIGYVEGNALPKLQNGELSLDNNRIRFIEVKTFTRMNNLTIRMYRNPFSCHCNNKEFAKWIRDNKQSITTKKKGAGNGLLVPHADAFTCYGPHDMYGKKVIDFIPEWWQCNHALPGIAVACAVAAAAVVAGIVLILYFNRLDIKHWQLEKQDQQENEKKDQKEDEEREEERSLPRTRVLVTYDMKDKTALTWSQEYLDENISKHQMKISLKWAIAPGVKPLWQQVKEVSPSIDFCLVLVTDEFLAKHWPDLSEKSGVHDLMKFVFVLIETKCDELPKDLQWLQCPCLEWPEIWKCACPPLTYRRRQFWNELRVVLKGTGYSLQEVFASLTTAVHEKDRRAHEVLSAAETVEAGADGGTASLTKVDYEKDSGAQEGVSTTEINEVLNSGSAEEGAVVEVTAEPLEDSEVIMVVE